MVETENLLRDLIALPSVNPAFLPAGHVRAGEQRVGEFLAALAARAGLDVEFREVFPKRSNLLASLSPRGKVKQRVLLAPHLDTVNGTDEQFNPQTRNGRLYGRGASDAKGTVAAMFAALCEMSRSGARPAGTEVVFAGLIDEENAQAGSRALAEARFKAELAVVGEPTCLRVVTAHKGSLWLRLETHGKSAHGARPELGDNAIHSMAQIVCLLETKYATQLKRRRHPLLGSPTVSVGVVAGGTQPNIVPDRCAISVDRRTLPGETETIVRREITALLRRNGLRVTFGDDKLAPCLPLETDPRHPLVAQLLREFRQSKPAGVHYFCDAAVLAQGGIPSVVFGPGDIAQGHTADEWISIAALTRSKRMLVQFLRSLA
jgi:acetylornithine deacetylase/succinyl-diaminopimelate desuccinylase-like protein